MESIVVESLRNSLPRMVTALPGPKSKELLAIREENVPVGVSYGTPTFIERGEGAVFEDVDGNVILDFVGGIGVLNIGYSHPEVVEVVKEQAEKFLHTSINVIQYEPYIRLAEKLNQIVPGNFEKRTMFINSGAEAVENAIKIARKHTKRSEVVVFSGAFHGRTNLTMQMTSKVKPYKHGFGPFTPGIHRAEVPYIYRRPEGISEENAVEYYKNQINKFFLEVVEPTDVAAIIIEPLQGEGGFVPVHLDFIKELRRICDENGILLIADEVQTGYCRTGKMYATEYWAEAGVYADLVTSAKSIGAGLPISSVTGRAEVMNSSQVGGIGGTYGGNPVAGVYADLVTSAKSIGAGLPISSVTGRAEVMNSSQVGGIGGTYGGNPVAVVGALKVIEIMERDNYAQKSMDIGKVVTDRLTDMKDKYEIIGEVRGLGAMIGLELVTDRKTKSPAAAETKAVVSECANNGLILLNAGLRGNVIRFLMPLCITDEQLECGLNIIENAIKKVSNK